MSRGFAHVEFASIAEAEKVLEHYVQNSFRILDREVRMDRASRLGGPYRRSRRLDFARWEEDRASLHSHFGALSSKIARSFFGKSISPFPCLVFDNSHRQKPQYRVPHRIWFYRIP